MKTNKIITSQDILFDENAARNWNEGKIENRIVDIIKERRN